jgi:hypothetical protein
MKQAALLDLSMILRENTSPGIEVSVEGFHKPWAIEMVKYSIHHCAAVPMYIAALKADLRNARCVYRNWGLEVEIEKFVPRLRIYNTRAATCPVLSRAGQNNLSLVSEPA